MRRARAPLFWVVLFSFFQPEIAVAQAPLTLAEAVRRVLGRNERAAIATEERLVAEARLRKARSFFLPDLTLSGGYRRSPEIVRPLDGSTVTVREADSLTGAVRMQLTLFDARGFPSYGAASLERDAQGLATSEDRRRLSFEVADAFLIALGTEQIVQAAERRLELGRRALEEARARRRAALVGANDVTKAELELATAEREAADAHADATSARLALGHLLGGWIDGALIPPAELINPGSVERPEALMHRARRQRMDMRRERLRAQAANRLAVEPLLRALPSVTLVGQVSATSSPGFTGREIDWFAGVDLVWPLYDGGERYADGAERAAQARMAELRALATARTVELEVRLAVSALESRRRATRAAEAASVAARRNAEEVAVLYRQGLGTALDAADARLRSFEAEVGLARAGYAQGRAVLDLRAAVGLDPLGLGP